MYHHLMIKFAVAFAFSITSLMAAEMATVSIFAQPMGKTGHLDGIEVYDVIQKAPLSGLVASDGSYDFQYPVDHVISLLFKRKGYAASQSGVFMGVSREQNTISWQAIPDWLWDSVRYAAERHTSEMMKPGYCQLITTVKAKKTMLNNAQRSGFQVSLVSNDWIKRSKPHGSVFYFGSLANKSPFIPGLDEAKVDGGVVIMNIEPGRVYTITTNKHEVEFSTPYFSCNSIAWNEAAPDETMLISLNTPLYSRPVIPSPVTFQESSSIDTKGEESPDF